MLNKAWPLLLCKLNKHDWLIELRGHAYQGSVYPIRFRICKHCQCTEQEVFDETFQTAYWRRVDNGQGLTHE